MKRGRVVVARGLAALASVVVAALVCVWTAAADAATITVCHRGCAHHQIAPAIRVASAGDEILVGPGTYRGGFDIPIDLTLAGAGAGQTTIIGGGPVVTVGTTGAATEPTVQISGVTITGGRTTSSFYGRSIALGGGVYIPPGAVVDTHTGDRAPGATVTIENSDIVANKTAPTRTVGTGMSCGAADCRFAEAGGGGIDSWGTVTVRDSLVADNVSGGPTTSDADGAGIYGEEGSLTLDDDTVTGNRARARAPDGRNAEGAGVLFATFAAPPSTCVAPQPSCALTIKDSSITDNASTLHTDLPALVDGALLGLSVNGGGINVGPSIPTTITGTHIDDNLVTAVAPNGEPVAVDAGMIVGDSPLTMSNSTVEDNRTDAVGATFADTGVVGSALELDGPGSLNSVTVAGNETRITATRRVAEASGALAIFNFTNDPAQVTVTDSAIVHNRIAAVSAHGTAQALGGGVFNNSLLSLSRTLVAANQTAALASSGVAQGGGIWNGVDLSGPPVTLTLDHSAVTGNLATGSPGVTASGGGLYTTSPVTLTASAILFNRPDQCVGCSPSAAAPAPANVTAAGARSRAPDLDGSR